jgi:TldD protein
MLADKQSRRDFLKTCAAGAAAGKLLHGCGLTADVNPYAMTLKDYYDRFEVNENIIRRTISEALATGGDFCDLYFQHTIFNNIGLEDHAVNRAENRIDYGVGVRVIIGDQVGYTFTEEISESALKNAARTASAIAASGKSPGPAGLSRRKTPDFYPIARHWQAVSIEKKLRCLQKLDEKIFALDKRIIKANISFRNETSYILMADSEGNAVCDYRPLAKVGGSCTAEDKGRREQNWHALSGRVGFDYFTPERIDYIAQKAVDQTRVLFDAVKPEGGEMEVVLAAGDSGILLHEAIGHGMEADFNRKKISIFCEKMGKPVAENFVSIVDDGTNPVYQGSLNVDDEGNNTEKTFLVRDGALESYLHDRISAKHYKVKPTGSGRRQSFRFPVQPRMRNTYMLPGPHKKEEIIKSVKNGLYAEQFTNGQVMIGAGDFTFYLKLGYLIQDGKLTRPVKDVNIIGNGPQVLKDIVMVGDDLKVGDFGGYCGKGGQRVPVTMGLPTVKVSKITVGGEKS